MKIAFWSNIRKRGGVTTNMACIAAISAISGMGKSVLLENHYNINNLNGMLLTPEKISRLRETGQYYNKYGIEYILKRLYTGESGNSLIQEASIPLLYSSIYYLPQSYIVNKEVFNYEFELVHKELFRTLERVAEMVLIDTESSGNASSMEILEEADIIVVNIDQNAGTWEDYFENYASLAQKSVFLVGRYQREYNLNLFRIRKEYHIPSSRIGVIPYNMELQEAAREGHILQFLNRNYLKNGYSDNRYFMQEVKRSAVMLRDNILNDRNTGLQRKNGN